MSALLDSPRLTPPKPLSTSVLVGGGDADQEGSGYCLSLLPCGNPRNFRAGTVKRKPKAGPHPQGLGVDSHQGRTSRPALGRTQLWREHPGPGGLAWLPRPPFSSLHVSYRCRCQLPFKRKGSMLVSRGLSWISSRDLWVCITCTLSVWVPRSMWPWHFLQA